MKMEINGVQTELSVEEFVKLSKILESKPEETAEVSGIEEKREFSVGDVVVVVDGWEEDVAVITKDDKSDWRPFHVEYKNGETDWCDTDELRKLAGEELAKYNRELIEEGD